MTATPSPSSRILIIDDDDAVTATFARMLRLDGHQVRTASSAEVGLREAERETPDAIILDLRMPLINGLGFLYRLRAAPHHRSIPVAIVTGDYFLDDVVLGEISTLGAELHFKPLWLEDLVTLAHELLQGDRGGTKPPILTH